MGAVAAKGPERKKNSSVCAYVCVCARLCVCFCILLDACVCLFALLFLWRALIGSNAGCNDNGGVCAAPALAAAPDDCCCCSYTALLCRCVSVFRAHTKAHTRRELGLRCGRARASRWLARLGTSAPRWSSRWALALRLRLRLRLRLGLGRPPRGLGGPGASSAASQACGLTGATGDPEQTRPRAPSWPIGRQTTRNC